MIDSFAQPQPKHGWIEVIVGSMFSGKTEELLKQVRRATIARHKVKTFKPRIDSRYSVTEVSSHDQNRIPSIPVEDAAEIFKYLEPSDSVIAIDEGQFFAENIVDVANTLAESGRRVIISGLDTDWRGRPFGPMPHLMAIAEVVRKQHAICRVCGGLASRTQRLIADQDDILVGSTESYEARCRLHFDPDLGARTLTAKPHHLSLSEA